MNTLLLDSPSKITDEKFENRTQRTQGING